jgi:Helicase associated domain
MRQTTEAVSARALAWPRFLDELDWWIEEHGDAAVPQTATSRSVDGAPYPLGRRVKAYRDRYRRGALDAERAASLEGRQGWSWDGYAPRSSRVWDQHLATIREYAAEHRSLDGLESANAPAARWLREQRTAELTPAQRRQLARIPGALAQRKGRLEEFVAAMRGWLEAEPDRDAGAVQFSSVYRVGRNDVPLGKRVAYWRSRYAAGRLSAAEVDAIDALPGWSWDPPRRRAEPAPDDAPAA